MGNRSLRAAAVCKELAELEILGIFQAEVNFHVFQKYPHVVIPWKVLFTRIQMRDFWSLAFLTPL